MSGRRSVNAVQGVEINLVMTFLLLHVTFGQESPLQMYA